MKTAPQKPTFEALLNQYIRQMSKRHRLPKEVENQLLAQLYKKSAI